MNNTNTTSPHLAAQLYQRWLAPLVQLMSHLPYSPLAFLARFSIAAVFWQSGQTKVQGFAINFISGMRKRMQTHPNDIEDLVQETLMAIHQKRHTYDSQQPLTAWVYAIARYKWIDHLRVHGRRTPAMEDIDDFAEVLCTESDSGHSDTRHDLVLMLAELPDKQRLSIEHTRLQGLSIAQTAAATGQTEAAVKVNVHRGLKALSERWASA